MTGPGTVPGPSESPEGTFNYLARVPESLRRLLKHLTPKRRRYDFTAAREHSATATSGSTLATIFKRFSFCRRFSKDTLTNDEKFHLALYNEGLIAGNYVVNDQTQSDSVRVLLVHEHPVISIGHGFGSDELRRPRRGRCVRASHRNISWSGIRSGIDKVLQGIEDSEAEPEPEIDDMPVSLWLDVLEPVIMILMSLKTGRSNRLNITHRRRTGPTQTGHRVVIGDSPTTFFMQGPILNPAPLRGGLFTILNNRFMELGGRSRRYRNARLADVMLPASSNRVPTQNNGRSRATVADPQARRHGVSTTSRITETQDDITIPENHVTNPRSHNP